MKGSTTRALLLGAILGASALLCAQARADMAYIEPPPNSPDHYAASTQHEGAQAAQETPAATSEPEPEPEPERDGPRRRWLWIEASGGYSWINLLQMRDENFTSEPELLSGSGFVFEGGLGISLLRVFQIGMTASYAKYANFDIVTAELDLTLVIPIPIIEPFIRAGVGYAHLGQLEVASSGGMQEKARVNGITVDLGAGLDLRLSDAFQLGFAVDASFLNLRRQRVTELGTLPHADFTQKGNALGLQVNGSVRLTFRF